MLSRNKHHRNRFCKIISLENDCWLGYPGLVWFHPEQELSDERRREFI